MDQQQESFGELRALVHDASIEEPHRLAALADILTRLAPPVRDQARCYALRQLDLPEHLQPFDLRQRATELRRQTLAALHGRHTEALYEVFARYPRPPQMPHCSPFIEARAASSWAAMVAAPLPKLGPDALSFFAFRALTTWGGADDLRHFLPRLLELCHEERLGVDPEIFYGKLTYGGWRDWPTDEQEILRRWMLSSWELQLCWPRAFIASALCRIGSAQLPLQQALERWQPASPHHPGHLIQLAELVCSFGAEISAGHQDTAPAFWQAEDFARMRRWALRPEHVEALEEALLCWEMPEEMQWRFDEAIRVLQRA